MPTLALTNGVIHYLDEGQGNPLILLHANPGDSRDFTAVIPALAQHYRVLALDWPGYGSSWVPRPEQMHNDFLISILREFITALKLPPVTIIGNSMGGHTAARLAIESPERVQCLVLVSPGGFTPPGMIASAFCKLQSSRFSLPPSLFARLYVGRRNATINAMLARAKGMQSEPARIAINRALWRYISKPEYLLLETAKVITVPTLLMFGETDPVISAKKDGRAARNTLKNAEFAVLAAGHAPFAETPELFLNTVIPFLTKFAEEPAPQKSRKAEFCA